MTMVPSDEMDLCEGSPTDFVSRSNSKPPRTVNVTPSVSSTLPSHLDDDSEGNMNRQKAPYIDSEGKMNNLMKQNDLFAPIQRAVRALCDFFKGVVPMDAKSEQTGSLSDNDDERERNEMNLKRFAPALGAVGFMIAVMFLNVSVSREVDWTLSRLAGELMWKNASVRPPLLVIVVVAGWAGVVRVCRASALNLDSVLGGPVQSPVVTLHSSLIFLVVLLVAHVIHMIASQQEGLTWRPFLTCNLSLHVAFVLIGLMPLRVLQLKSRTSLMRALFESFIAPFGPVTFWHVIVADYLTSMAKAFSDIQMTTCISTNIFFDQRRDPSKLIRTAELWTTYHNRCNASYASLFALAFPFWLRLMQCLKVYSKTREQKNLWNALKYSTAFPLIYAGHLKVSDPSPFHNQLFITAAVVQSCFTFVWDVLMDWGLPQRAAFGSSAHSTSTCCGLVMRERLVVSHRKRVYWMLCISNLLMRFAWTLAAFGGVASHGAGMFFFEVIEIFRRTLWAIFRIEWEVINKGITTSDHRYKAVALDTMVEVEDREAARATVKIGKAVDS